MRALAPLALATLVLTAASTAAADELVAPVGGPIDAVGSHLAYSRPDGSRFALVIDGNPAPVATSSTPFDVDLGTDRRGRLVAVYTRPRAARRRDVVWLDVASGRERPVVGASGRARDEKAASVSRGTVAFSVTTRPRDRLFTVPLSGGRVRALRTPDRDFGPSLTVERTELAGGVLAFVAGERANSDFSETQLWFSRAGGRPRKLFRSGGTVNRATDFVGLAVSVKWVTVGLAPVGDSFDRLGAVRFSPARGTRQRTPLADVPHATREDRTLEGFAVGSGGTYTSACSALGGPDECRLVRTTLRWRPL